MDLIQVLHHSHQGSTCRTNGPNKHKHRPEPKRGCHRGVKEQRCFIQMLRILSVQLYFDMPSNHYLFIFVVPFLSKKNGVHRHHGAFISFWILMSVAPEIESWATLPQRKNKKYFMAFPHKAKGKEIIFQGPPLFSGRLWAPNVSYREGISMVPCPAASHVENSRKVCASHLRIRAFCSIFQVPSHMVDFLLKDLMYISKPTRFLHP